MRTEMPQRPSDASVILFAMQVAKVINLVRPFVAGAANVTQPLQSTDLQECDPEDIKKFILIIVAGLKKAERVVRRPDQGLGELIGLWINRRSAAPLQMTLKQALIRYMDLVEKQNDETQLIRRVIDHCVKAHLAENEDERRAIIARYGKGISDNPQAKSISKNNLDNKKLNELQILLAQDYPVLPSAPLTILICMETYDLRLEHHQKVIDKVAQYCEHLQIRAPFQIESNSSLNQLD